ncbi:MAG: hypothetical protein JRH11_14855 [Deltaproteobacteria bacterium]|nr:hypothetical protein [Deltaproteobacteria bacterium]
MRQQLTKSAVLAAGCALALIVLGGPGCARRDADVPPGDGGGDASFPEAGLDGSTPDTGNARDASVDGETPPDAWRTDSGAPSDGGETDSGSRADGGASDASPMDGGAPSDGGGPADTGTADTGPADTGPPDTGPADTGAPPAGGCISGATGTHALRFRWDGSTSGSTAYVAYETNTLPDTSRWRVTAASRSIGYRPVFRDPFLGEGGLELSGTVFIDVELSTLGLPAGTNVTLAIYGRSYNTTASGSFAWQTFSGTGASPRGGVANSAPYEWYGADATAALPAGDDGTLLRISAAGPSNSLIVNRAEVCFDVP